MSTDDVYEWADGASPPRIAEHSLAKHDVLDRYLRRYVEVVTSNPRRRRLRLTLVDGFSGGGLYTKTNGELHLGSPLRMIHAMKSAEAVANSWRQNPLDLDVEFLFIEKNRQTIDYLNGVIRDDPYGREYLGKDKIHFIHGSFKDHFNNIVDCVAARGIHRCIFLLDQYGYSDVPLPLIKMLFERFRHAEVMLTFMTDWLLDFLSEQAVTADMLSRLNLHHLEREFQSVLQAKESSSPEWRRAAQALLYRDLWQGSGAGYFTPFFIRSTQSHRDYWFVHLSAHERARDEMAKLHWDIQNRFSHYGKAGFSMLGYDPGEDPRYARQLDFNFSGDDRARTHALLMGELPRKLEQMGGELPFSEFFRRVCNDTPATERDLKNVIKDLSAEGHIEISTTEGKPRGRGVIIESTNVLRVSKQTWISWPTRG